MIRTCLLRCFASAALFSAVLSCPASCLAQDRVPDDPYAENQERSVLPVCPTDEELRATIRPIAAIQATMTIDPELTKEEGLPLDCAYHVFQDPVQPTALYPSLTEFNWRPTNFFHQPLYFDDQPLERYGQTLSPHLQPVISGTRFFATFPIIPYKMGIDRTHDCISTLAYHRPGRCLPCIREKIIPRFELDAGLLQAGTAVALIFMLP